MFNTYCVFTSFFFRVLLFWLKNAVKCRFYVVVMHISCFKFLLWTNQWPHMVWLPGAAKTYYANYETNVYVVEYVTPTVINNNWLKINIFNVSFLTGNPTGVRLNNMYIRLQGGYVGKNTLLWLRILVSSISFPPILVQKDAGENFECVLSQPNINTYYVFYCFI
jgi:hypothetical protein